MEESISEAKGDGDAPCEATGTTGGITTAYPQNYLANREYACGECNLRSFSCSNDLFEHALRHRKMKEFACTSCSASFPTSKDLRKHTQSKHTRQLNNAEKDNVKRVRARYVLVRLQEQTPSKFVLMPAGDEEAGKKSVRKRKHHLNDKLDAPVFVCQTCDETLHGPTSCKKHLADVHSGESSLYQCIHCLRTKTSLKCIRAHISSSECGSRGQAGVGRFVCYVCSKVVSSKETLEMHMLQGHSINSTFGITDTASELGISGKTALIMVGVGTRNKKECTAQNNDYPGPALDNHSLDPPNQCDICARCFKHKCDLRKHRMRHTGSKDFVCVKDGKRFHTKQELVSHTNYVHLRKKIPTTEEKLLCHICGFESWQKGTMRNHMVKVHGPAMTSHCETCDRIFNSAAKLNAHAKKLHTTHNVQCKECGKVVKAYNLKAHARTHVEGDFPCGVCEEVFDNSSKRDNHKYRKHKSEREPRNKFECTMCSYTTFQKEYLKKHAVVHNLERNFRCSRCDSTFAQLSSLMRHEQIHTGRRNHACDTCGKTFIQKCSLDRHRVTHEGSKPYVCEVCGAGYSQSYTLTKHTQKKHPDVPQSSSKRITSSASGRPPEIPREPRVPALRSSKTSETVTSVAVAGSQSGSEDNGESLKPKPPEAPLQGTIIEHREVSSSSIIRVHEMCSPGRMTLPTTVTNSVCASSSAVTVVEEEAIKPLPSTDKGNALAPSGVANEEVSCTRHNEVTVNKAVTSYEQPQTTPDGVGQQASQLTRLAETGTILVREEGNQYTQSQCHYLCG